MPLFNRQIKHLFVGKNLIKFKVDEIWSTLRKGMEEGARR